MTGLGASAIVRHVALGVGTVVAGKYRIERLLGEGGMGTVYVATNLRLHKEVALKVLGEAVAGSPEAADRFMREAIAASRVKHPGIVEIFDADVHEGQPWIAMELLRGESLGDRLERGALSIDEALDVVIEALGVLEPVHQAGIVHRDLKPDNLFLDIQGDGRRRVKVLDFGIAKIHGGELGEKTKTGMAMGTPFFLAPEQARNAKETDARADLYAVGVILYHALTRALPYQAESFGDLVAQMFTGGPRPLASVAPHLPPELCAAVDRCLAVDRDRRPPSARALRDELASLRAHLAGATPQLASTVPMQHAPATPPMGAFPSPPTPMQAPMPAARSAPIWPWALAGLGLLGLLGLGGLIAALVALRPDPAAPPIAAPAPRVEPPPVVAPAPVPMQAIERVPEPSPVAVAVAEPEPEPAPEEATARLSPAEAERRAADCMTSGDNICVVELLEGPGNAPTPRALGMLIEAHRALGQSQQAQRHMERFVQRYPNHPRARSYRQILQINR